MSRPYAPVGQYLWDFWIFEERGQYHLFHLQAPLELSPRLRHRSSSVGYALSNDLKHWVEMGTVLTASENDKAWDSVSIWTGCTIKKGDIYYMFYTSRSKQDVLDDGYVGHTQRIGVATSMDLRTWSKYKGNPIVTADYRWYESQAEAHNRHEACRDPFVVYSEDERYYYMFFTARDNKGEPRSRGCIGKARSKDLLNWEIMPPAVSPHTFTDMEVPSVHRKNDLWYILFAVKEDWYSEDYRRTICPDKPQTGELYYVSDSLEGKFWSINHKNVLTDTKDQLYTGRIVSAPAGGHVFLSWHAGADEGFPCAQTPYTLTAPLKVIYDQNNMIRVE
jgi:beta-fructofuranosidase